MHRPTARGLEVPLTDVDANLSQVFLDRDLHEFCDVSQALQLLQRRAVPASR